MSRQEKLISKLKSRKIKMTYDELVTLLKALGFKVSNKGKTSGSRVSFVKGQLVISIHKPHPHNELKEYQIKEIVSKLEEEKII